MRQIFTISCLGLFFISSAQTIKAKEKNAIVFRCRAIPSSSSNEPLFVIDGIPKEKFNPKEIDPDNIESINISNEANSALIFCNTNPRCVILITTKTANQRVIKVKDILTGEIIPGATIELAYKENNRDTSLYRQTDSVGSFITNKITDGKEYELKVSSVGYKPFKTIINSKMIGKGYSVLLEKNYSQLSEVVITTDGSKTIRCWACCITRVVKDLLVEKASTKHEYFRVYPNPAKSGSDLKIGIKNNGEPEMQIELFNLAGQLITTSSLNNYENNPILSYQLPKLIAGTYLLRITSKKSRKSQAEKIIIQ